MNNSRIPSDPNMLVDYHKWRVRRYWKIIGIIIAVPVIVVLVFVLGLAGLFASQGTSRTPAPVPTYNSPVPMPAGDVASTAPDGKVVWVPSAAAIPGPTQTVDVPGPTVTVTVDPQGYTVMSDADQANCLEDAYQTNSGGQFDAWATAMQMCGAGGYTSDNMSQCLNDAYQLASSNAAFNTLAADCKAEGIRNG